MSDVPVLAPAEDAAPAKGKSKKSKTLIMALLGVLVLAGAGIGGWLWLSSGKPAKGAQHKAEAQSPALYVALDPPFVVNFEAEQAVRFLQVTMQVMTRDPATVEMLKANDPVVRNDLLLLLGNQKYTVISTREGKEHLQNDALAAIRRVIASVGGKPERVEAIYFTSFVMQ